MELPSIVDNKASKKLGNDMNTFVILGKGQTEDIEYKLKNQKKC